jgi:hypothetical protein
VISHLSGRFKAAQDGNDTHFVLVPGIAVKRIVHKFAPNIWRGPSFFTFNGLIARP